MNIAHLLQRSGAAYGPLPALARGREVVASYSRFADHAATLGRWLAQTHGIGPDTRVAVFMANCVEYLELLYGIWWSGATAVPINAKLHPKEVAWILENSGTRLCLMSDSSIGELEPLKPAACVLAGYEAAIADALRENPSVRADAPAARDAPLQRAGDDIAWLFYTSGTTGRPKGVMITHRNLLLATLAYLSEVQAVAAGDACLHPAPLSHGSGLYNFSYVARGGINVVPDSQGFDPAEVFDLIACYPGSSFFAAPTMVKRLVDHARFAPPGDAVLRNLQTIAYGGGPMYAADIDAALASLGQKFAQIYGQGESPMTISVLPKQVIAESSHPRYRERLASVGYAQTMVEISIRATGDGPALTPALAAGEVGEVCVRGDVVMRGYWNNPEATQAAIRAGWLYTGDIGVLDDDGFLTLKDRSKDLIISGGTNIYPREVEEALLQHSAVAETSVIGVPDPQWGESVWAYVVLRGEARSDAAAAALSAELDQHCLDRIARFKRPKRYRFVSELPKNNYGKVLKTVLRERAQAEARANPP
jgi:long-chain acyl-CoA synthetase